MERLNEQDLEEFSRSLRSVYAESDKMLQFNGETIRMLEFRSTGETEHRSIQTGGQEYVFKVPIKEAVLVEEYDQIADFADTIEHSHFEHRPLKKIESKEYQEWLESLPKKEDFIRSAQEILASRDGAETLPCQNCKGNKSFMLTCNCVDGSIHYIDTEDQTSLSDAKADPNCDSCHGSGEVSNPCPACHGAGYMMKYPIVRYVNIETGQEIDIKLDMAQLVVDGKIDIKSTGFENGSAHGGVAQRGWSFKLSNLLESALYDMGIDLENFAFVRNDRINSILNIDVTIGSFTWSAQNGSSSTGSFRGNIDIADPTEIINEAQKNIASRHNWLMLTDEEESAGNRREIALKKYGKVIDENMIVLEDIFFIKQLRPMEDAFNDLLDAVVTKGYTLGYSQSFIATGESGPSFYLLDIDGKVITQLSNDYSIRDSIENAWTRLQEISDKI